MNKVAIALVMMLLVLSMPAVSAYSIKSIDVRGEDGIEDYVKNEDTITITAVADIDQEVVTADAMKSQIIVGVDQPFEGCEQNLDGTWTCVYTKEINDYYKTIYDYTIKLYNPYEERRDVEHGQFFVDNTAPQIEQLSTRQEGKHVIINFKASDTAYYNAPTNRCVGLNDLFITKQTGELIKSYNISGCSLDSQYTINASEFEESGYVSLCVEVTDKFDLSDERCITFRVDLDAPQIGNPVIVYTYDRIGESHSYPYNTYIGQTQTGLINFTVTENDRIQSVSMSVGQTNVPVSCVLTSGNTYQCGVTAGNQVTFRPGNNSIKITVVDGAGNEFIKETSLVLNLDEQPPILIGLKTDLLVDETYYVGPKTIVSATFNEEATGFFEKNVLLLGQYPRQCEGAQGRWICSWENLSLTGRTAQIGLQDAYDDANNRYLNGSLLDVTLDYDAPTMRSFEAYTLTDTSVKLGYAIAGEPVHVVVNFTDALDVTGVADFSDIEGGVVQGDCSTRYCIFESEQVMDIYGEGQVIINLTDQAGNRLSQANDIEVLGLADGTVNKWSHDVSLSPGAINRGTAEMINNVVYAHIKLKSRSGGELLDAVVESCDSADNESDMLFVSKYEQVDATDAELKNQYIAFYMKAVSYEEVNTLNIVCQMRLTSVSQNELSTNEIENVSISIPLYGLAGDGLGKEYEEDLEEAIEDATEGMLNTIASWEKYVNLVVEICNIMQTVWKVIEIWGIVKEGYTAGASAAEKTGFGKGVSDGLAALGGSMCEAEESGKEAATQPNGGIMKFLRKFCDFVTCRYSIWDMFKWGGDTGGNDGDLEAATETVNTELASSPTFGHDSSDPGSIPGGSDLFGDALSFGMNQPGGSIVWSIAMLCIPGILKKLNELRQIKCQYALCLRDQVPQGVPKQACDTLLDYQTCKYWWGEIFSAIPPVAFLNNIFEQIKTAISTPTGMIGMVWGLTCMTLCKVYADGMAETNWASVSCGTYQILKVGGEIVSDVTHMMDSGTWSLEGDICSELEGGLPDDDAEAEDEE